MSTSETAINIGYSCRLLTENMDEVFIINGSNSESVKSSIENFQQRIAEIKRQSQGENVVRTPHEEVRCLNRQKMFLIFYCINISCQMLAD